MRVAPPTPVIERAWRDAQRVYIDVRMNGEPDECKPVSVRVAVFSEADGSNQALPPPGNDWHTSLENGRAQIVLRRPILDLPPYVVVARAYGAKGEESESARYTIPEQGDYCLRHRSAERCVIEAQALAKRCSRGEAPRSKCADWSYGSQRPPPAIPVEGASVEAVRKNLRAVLLRGTYNDVRLDSIVCSPAFVCVATFRRAPGEGTLRVRYVLSGHRGEKGCWFAARIDIVEPPEETRRSPLAPFAPLNNQASCLHWR